MTDPSFLTLLSLGFVLGLRHALDADHIAAVSTMLAQRPSLKTSGTVGFFWGVGHTLTLFALAVAVIALNVRLPAPFARVCELGVGIMLVILGLSLARRLYRDRWHVHTHEHEGERHLHFHRHGASPVHEHPHWAQGAVRPFLVGMVHGLAGSAALLLVVLSSVTTVTQGLSYVLVFGVGSIAGMMLLGVVLTVPVVWSMGGAQRGLVAIQAFACVASIGLGVAMVVRIGFGSGLLS
jgi:hypothetical protein